MDLITGMLQLDYGGFTDSKGAKVNLWSATLLTSFREPEHIDFFFNAANQHSSSEDAGAKKNGSTGIFFLRELLDPEKAPPEIQTPGKKKICLLEFLVPGLKVLWLSGDTGNGYRAYEMLQELSTVFEKYGYKIFLAPLAPGHAHNRTDARIAHINTFLNAAKGKSRVFGAEGLATAMHAASSLELTNRREFMSRSHVFFRRVEPPELEVFTHMMMTDDTLDHGRMGVRGFLYFDFSLGSGMAKVREHADTSRDDNPTRIYTWRKELLDVMCQKCSDREVKYTRTHCSTSVPSPFLQSTYPFPGSLCSACEKQMYQEGVHGGEAAPHREGCGPSAGVVTTIATPAGIFPRAERQPSSAPPARAPGVQTLHRERGTVTRAHVNLEV